MALSKLAYLILTLGVLAVLAACHRPVSYPETNDPVYQDMQKEVEKAVKGAEAAKKDLALAKTEVEKTPMRSKSRRRAEEAVYRAQEALEKAEQLVLYKKQQLVSRRKKDRKEYLEAFEAGKPWPPPEEITEYQTHKRLVEAPREWKPHIPPKNAPPKTASEGGHH